MSSTLSFSRLGKLITKQLYENSRLYLFAILALFGLIALMFTFWLFVSGPRFEEEGTYFMFLIGLFIAGTVFASMSFNMLGSKDKGIYWLSVPATHLEKLICTILFTTIAFTLVYCLCFFLVKSISISFLTGYIKDHPNLQYIKLNDPEGNFMTAIMYFIYAYFAVQALYLLGSVYFPRYSFILTTVFGALLMFTFVYYVSRIEKNMLSPADWDLLSVKKHNVGPEGSYHLYSLSPTIANIIQYTFQFAWAPLFWIVTWFRLKEKEV